MTIRISAVPGSAAARPAAPSAQQAGHSGAPSAMQQAGQPTVQSAASPAEQPAVHAAAQPMVQPTVQSAAQLAEQPVVHTPAQPTGQPTVQSAAQRAAQAITQPAAPSTARQSAPRRRPLRSRLALLWSEIKRHKISYLFLAPFLLLFTFFIIVPIITSIALSFSYYNILESPRFIGFSNYKLLFVDDDIFMQAVGITLKFAFITGPVGYVMAFLLAWLISQIPIKYRFFYTLCFYTPSITSATAMSVVWLYMFAGDRKGLLNNWLIQIGLLDEPFLYLQDIRSIVPVIIIVSLWMSMGVGFLAFLAGLQNVPKDLYEAGAIDGIRNRWQQLFYITVPAVKPQLLFGAIMQVVSSLQVFDISVQLVGLPSPLYAGHTILTHLFDYAFIRFEMGYASAIAVVLFLLMMGLNRLIFNVLGRD